MDEYKLLSKMINNQKRIKQLKALLISREIRVTLWTDNWSNTGVGGVEGSEDIFGQKQMKKEISQKIKSLSKEFLTISYEYPREMRKEAMEKAKQVALEEKW